MNQGDVQTGPGGLQPMGKHWLCNACSPFYDNRDAELSSSCWRASFPHCSLIQPHWTGKLPQSPAQLMLHLRVLTARSGWLVSMLSSSGFAPSLRRSSALLSFVPICGVASAQPRGPQVVKGTCRAGCWDLLLVPGLTSALQQNNHRFWYFLPGWDLLYLPAKLREKASSRLFRKSTQDLPACHWKQLIRNRVQKLPALTFFPHICYFIQLQGWERKNAELEAKTEHYNVLFECIFVLLYWSSFLVYLLGFTLF